MYMWTPLPVSCILYIDGPSDRMDTPPCKARARCIDDVSHRKWKRARARWRNTQGATSWQHRSAPPLPPPSPQVLQLRFIALPYSVWAYRRQLGQTEILSVCPPSEAAVLSDIGWCVGAGSGGGWGLIADTGTTPSEPFDVARNSQPATACAASCVVLGNRKL